MKFSVVKGGLDPSASTAYRFLYAQITNTRLMGVVSMHIAWTPVDFQGPSVHQFYYYDYEETGLEHVSLYIGDDKDELKFACADAMAGLGGKFVDLEEREARYLACFFAEETIKKGQPLPVQYPQIRFVCEPPAEERINLSAEEIFKLNLKFCVPVKSNYGAVNYFLMRCIGGDREGAGLLLADTMQEIPGLPFSGAFLRNKISAAASEEACGKGYFCESLVEGPDSHYLMTFHVDVSRKKIIYARLSGCFPVSEEEASMLLSREEYVTVFETGDCENFEEILSEIMHNSNIHSHPNGTMFINYKPDNSHVENRLFLLADDVRLMYFLSATGQLTVCSYKVQDIMDAEIRLIMGDSSKGMKISGRYRFAHPLLLDFAESDFDDFNEYVQALQEE